MPVRARNMLMFGLLPVFAACQSTVATPTSSATTASSAETEFTTNAFQIIEFVRQEGALASVEAQHPRVKALAQKLTNEANDFAAELFSAAKNVGIKPPQTLRNDLRVRLGHMQLQQGLDFDRTYIDDQIASREEELMMQQSMTTAGSSPQYMALMQRAQEIIRRNLDALRSLRAEVSSSR